MTHDEEIDMLRAHNKDLIAEHSDFLFALSEKAPHLMGCAKTVLGTWICDSRCLVSKVEQQQRKIKKLEKMRCDFDCSHCAA